MISWIFRTFFEGNYKTLLLSILTTLLIAFWIPEYVTPLFADPVKLSANDLTTQQFSSSPSKVYTLTGRIVADTGWSFHVSQEFLFFRLFEETTYYSVFLIDGTTILARTNSYIEPALTEITITGNIDTLSRDEFDIADEFKDEFPNLASSFVDLCILEAEKSIVDYLSIVGILLVAVLTLTGYYTFFRNKILPRFARNWPEN